MHFRYKLIVICILMMSLSACKEYHISRQLRSFMNNTITVPSEMQVICGRNICPVDTYSANKARLIILFDSLECSSCQINKLFNYVSAYEKIRALPDCDLMTVFSPRQEEYDETVRQLMILNFPYPIYIDFLGNIRKLNKCIPDDTKFHRFLINKNGKPVFVGNPMHSPQMMELFMETMDRLRMDEEVQRE